jgi:hypothetical protein
VAHGVHPSVKRVEPSGVDPPLDRSRPETRREQLSPRDHPVLPPSKSGDHRVRAKVADFAPHTGVKFSTLAHAPDSADPNATELTPSMPI